METLIILFIIYSLFQWLFGDSKNKKKQQQRKQQQARSQRETGQEEQQPQSWEEAMKELESIFTGESSKPEPKPREQQTQRSQSQPLVSDEKARESFSADPFSDDLTTRKKGMTKSESDNILKELEQDSDNPIFSGRASSTEGIYGKPDGVSRGEAALILENINEPGSARRAIMMKEIFDKPRAKNPFRRAF